MLIGLIVVVGALMTNMAMPISLADQVRIEIEGKVNMHPDTNTPINVNEYKIGELQKGDVIKFVVSDMRGDGDLKVLLMNTSMSGLETCLNILYSFFSPDGPGWTCGIICCGPCFLFNLKPTVPAIDDATITFEGEEKMFTVPEDGVYYIDVEAEGGNVVYKGYIEVIKPEK